MKHVFLSRRGLVSLVVLSCMVLVLSVPADARAFEMLKAWEAIASEQANGMAVATIDDVAHAGGGGRWGSPQITVYGPSGVEGWTRLHSPMQVYQHFFFGMEAEARAIYAVAFAHTPDGVAAGVFSYLTGGWFGAETVIPDLFPTAMAVGDGAVYVAGHTNRSPNDARLVKLNSSLEEQWTATYENPSSFDEPSAMALDADGNAYVVVYASSEVILLKYDPAGTLLWAATDDAAPQHMGSPSAVAVDDAGKVYVTGTAGSAMVTEQFG